MVRVVFEREMIVAGTIAAARHKVRAIASSTDALVLMQLVGAAVVGILRTSSR